MRLRTAELELASISVILESLAAETQPLETRWLDPTLPEPPVGSIAVGGLKAPNRPVRAIGTFRKSG